MCTHADNHNTCAVAAMDSCLFCFSLLVFWGVFWEISFVFREFALRLSTRRVRKKPNFRTVFKFVFLTTLVLPRQTFSKQRSLARSLVLNSVKHLGTFYGMPPCLCFTK